jgi:arylsulfatase A-like enzyme
MLTDAAIRRIKPEGRPYKVADMHGLYLLVQPGGVRYWRMDYRHEGKRETMALGVYPQVFERLDAAGYRTLFSGKWHSGVEPGQDPSARGSQHSFDAAVLSQSLRSGDRP